MNSKRTSRFRALDEVRFEARKRRRQVVDPLKDSYESWAPHGFKEQDLICSTVHRAPNRHEPVKGRARKPWFGETITAASKPTR